jgi:hypothetical protein
MHELRQKYAQQRANAAKRGIEFDLTFDEWREIWGGNFHRRGTGAAQLGMLRTRDEGGYSVGNVRLGTPKENQQERSVCLSVSRAQNWKKDEFSAKIAPLADTSWIRKRYVFDEYVENDE